MNKGVIIMKEIYVSNYAKDVMTEVVSFLSSNGIFVNSDDKRYTDLFDNVIQMN